MWELAAAVGSAFGVMFIAELGDKTQLLALGFGARYRLRTVAIGLLLGYAAAGAVATLVGGVLGAALPERPIALASGVLFLGFGLLALRRTENSDNDDDNEGNDGTDGTDGTNRVIKVSTVVASIALTIAVGEMGDKTQLATAALAARLNPVATWFGSTLGEVAAGMIGALAGQHLGTRLNPEVLRYASAVLFACFGVVLLFSAR
jgi:putative Ca2+/H+ antiporter (TMEM165/GDT1 family)